MREPMKYINGPMGFFAPCDTYVRWADYAALAAENERLRSASFVTAVPSDEYERLKAENERLRKAGDEMMEVLESEIPFTAMNAVNGWLAAKEGGAK